MTKSHVLSTPILLAMALSILPAAHAQNAAAPASRTLVEMAAGVEKRLVPNSKQVTITRSQDAATSGLIITIQPGEEAYPGISIKPEAAWDLSPFGHVAARVVNMGNKPISLSLRIDNAANWQDSPWNTESIYLAPGAAGTIKTIFGHSYGYKRGYKLNPAAVSNMVVFAGKSDEVQMFRIESVVAAGPAGETPPVDPNTIRVKAQNGFLLGTGVSVDVAKQISTQDAQAKLSGGGNAQLQISFSAAKGEQSVTLKPATGRWDLRDYLEVRVSVRNNGTAPISPRVRVDSNGGASGWSATAPLAPGAQRELVASFINATPINLSEKNGGNRITNDAVSGVTIAAENADNDRSLLVESIQGALPTPQIPAWLGKRPPVDGDWVKTLDDEFNGTSLDPSLWSIYGENYWDKTSHWSKENVILGGGMVRLRYQKKTGFNNDDPTQKASDYASGYLHTYGRWVQRYGYFEARMKMPIAPGLWPAFWMMPDRGEAVGPQWKRQDTGNRGMEFDIMEHLTRWGPNRFNIAMHYDGYGKEHKGVGSDRVYAQPDKDGFITCGLLWTPGSAIYYYNGLEVARWEDPRISDVPSILMFTLPMGGWDNNALDDARLPDDFAIDYVRVWQRKDLASPADGKKIAGAPQSATQPETK